MSETKHPAFQVLATVIALAMGACGVFILAYEAPNQPWNRWLGAAVVQFLFAWAFGAYALGIRGPFNWRKR